MCANLKWNTKIFIEKAKEAHGNRFDYCQSDYTRKRDSIKVICKKHGLFKITAAYHILNEDGGCKECAKQSYTKLRSSDISYFLKRAKETHGDIYDYSEVEYINKKTNVKIICKKHGPFYQRPSNHYHGSGCPQCSKENRGR